MSKQTVVLNDLFRGDCGGSGPLEVTITTEEHRAFIEFTFAGYDNPLIGRTAPVIIENRAGVPYVVIWGDPKCEDPTHEISLEKLQVLPHYDYLHMEILYDPTTIRHSLPENRQLSMSPQDIIMDSLANVVGFASAVSLHNQHTLVILLPVSVTTESITKCLDECLVRTRNVFRRPVDSVEYAEAKAIFAPG